MTRKKRNKKTTKRTNESFRSTSFQFPCLDQDDTVAYIAGYTKGGFAYGITWEEWEQFEQESSNSSELEIGRKPPGRKSL